MPSKTIVRWTSSPGITVIDDSYNANPDSYLPALKTLEHIARKKKSRKIVVIGDMLELGLNGEALHQELMLTILEYNVDGIFTLGKDTAIAAELLRDRGYKNIFSYESHNELGKSLHDFIAI